MTTTKYALFPLAALLTLSFAADAVHANTQTCDAVQSDVIAVDGLHDDWRGTPPQHVGAKARDASFSVRCAYDEQHLHLAVAVRDDYLYRGAKPSTRKDDHLIIELGVGKKRDRLLLYPGNDKQDPTRKWNRKSVPDWLQVEDTQARRGWTMEASIPLARIRGYGKGTPAIDARVEYRDADFSAKVESKLAFSGRLELEGASAVYKSFLAAAKLSKRDIKLDQMVNIDDHKGVERVIAGRDIVGVVSDGFFFMQLPVSSPSDVKSVQIVDLRGDGTHSVLAELTQHGNGGSRDLVIIYQVGANAFQQVLAVETRKQKGENSLVNRWSLAPKGKYRTLERGEKKRAKRGRDLVFEVEESDASGWDEDNYFEAQAQDVVPILLPWSDHTSAVYYFVGNAAQGGDPKRKRRR